MNRIQKITTAFMLCGAATVMGQNLITNPGFESAGEGWNLWKDASASEAVATITYPTTGARSGTSYAHIDVTTPSTDNWHIQFQPPADWEAGIGATYEMKFWAKSAASTSMHFSVQDGPSNGFMYRSGFDFGLSPEWTEYTFTYTSDVEGPGALRFFLYVGSVVDTYGFDDFSLVQVGAGINNGSAGAARQSLRVLQGSENLVVTLDGGVSENWKAELFDLRGVSMASASGRTDGSLVLANPKKSGTYVIRATAGNRTYVRQVSVK